jgi:pimeloyl-ACP methyl ester carboxylesterase
MDIEVDSGVSLFVQDLGEGRPVVLLPGLFMSHAVWDAQVCELIPHARTVCIDLRGHGKSSKPVSGYDIARHISDVACVLDDLDLTDVVLVGWSFGGAVAFGLAAARPDRIAKLMVVGSNAVRFQPDDGFPYGLDPAIGGALLAGEREARPAVRHGALHASFHHLPAQPYLDWLANDAMQTPSWAGAQCIQALVDLDQVALLPEVNVPVQQIHGIQDPSWPIEGTRWLNKQLQNASLVEYDECGHFPPLECQADFNRRLLSFVLD